MLFSIKYLLIYYKMKEIRFLVLPLSFYLDITSHIKLLNSVGFSIFKPSINLA